MHFHSRLLIGLTTALACAAITVPAHAAERPRPSAQTSTVTPSAAELAELDRLLNEEIEPGQDESARSRPRCNWGRCWWTQWVGPGHYIVAKYTWTGTWYLKNKTDSANTGFEALQIICSFISPWCGAFTWAAWNYWKYMLNRAIKNKRCLVTLSRTFGVGPHVFLRTARCSR